MRGWLEPRTTKTGEKRYGACWRDATGTKRSKTFRKRGDADTWLNEQVVERDLENLRQIPMMAR